MKKKRLLSWFLALVMMTGLLPMTAWAEETESATANVTISNAGELEIVHKAVTATDQNRSGSIDIDDVLYAAHEKFYDGGAESGYGSYTGDYGLSLGKLWGDDRGVFGYYVNDASAWSLADTVKDGDKVVAFVYQDKTGWSDKYSFFDRSDVSVKLEESKAEIDLTLSYRYWDTEANDYANAPISDVVITIDGETITDTDGNDIVTDADGGATISFDKEGTFIISAEKDDMNIVPPVCVVTVTEEQSPGTEDGDDSKTDDDEEDVNEPETPEGEVSVDALLGNISASYMENSGEWVIMDMAAYEDLNPKGSKTSDEAKQAYIKKAIESINKETVGETTYTKAILALTAIGIDAEELYPAGSETAISAIAGLNGKAHSSSEWSAPYTLMAYNQKDYADTAVYEDVLIEAVLENQNENGSWGGSWDKGIQSTANMIAGLVFYHDKDDVKKAINGAIDFLSKSQDAEGKFYDYSYSDANTAAMVVIGLCAAGVNPDTDERFVKNGTSAFDYLMSFALADNSGFGWKDNTSFNAGSTEQAFRALIAATHVMESGEAFNIYDFSHNAGSLKPGYAGKREEETPSDKPSTDKNKITVTVSVDADSDDWMEDKSVTVDEGATVYDAFIEALKGSGITQKGASSGYIESMTKDGETLGEFDEGDNSGWLYKVNGDLPDVGIKDYELEDGDEILFYYTKDWTKDPDAGSRYEEEEEEIPEEIIEEEGQEEIQPALQYPVIEELYTDISADSYYYEAAQWAVAEGITSGATKTEFGADWACSRGQLMTFIWRMMGSPAPETKRAPYIDVAEDLYYHDAILWAAENKFASGTDGISFSPDQTVTRAQAVVFLWRAAGCPEVKGTTAFTDVPEGEYYHDAVLWAAENGITFGTGEGMFSPDALCTRGQIVTFLHRGFAK